MANDLERFLQQAAERLRQKIEQNNPPPRPAAPPARPPVIRDAERGRGPTQIESEEEQVIEARLAEADEVLRRMGPDPLSSLDTRRRAESYVDQSDERMEEHLHDVFDHQKSQLGRSSGKLSDGVQHTQVGSQVSIRGHQTSQFVEILRQPDTLRAAFIAGEIFRRRF